MSETKADNPREEVLERLRAVNRAWIERRFEDLEELFDQEMVIAAPDFQSLAEDRDRCIQSYRDFMSRATVLNFEESDYHVLAWRDSAVIDYQYRITYEMEGKRHHDAGRDLFVFNRTDGAWRAVWRLLLPSPEK